MKTLSTEIASLKKNYPLVESLLYRANEEFGLPLSEFHNLMIAVSEIVMNAIVHANKEKETKKVRVSVEYDSEKMKVTILDEGGSYKFNSTEPHLPEDILKESGRGMFIVKSLIKDIDYIDKGNGSEFVLTIKKKK
jgi:serine/threonine-protein kinase RsbW